VRIDRKFIDQKICIGRKNMKVRDVMTHNVKTCTSESSLADVAAILWENDCGVVPVVDHAGKVIGMVTDRDICMAVATKNRLASEIKAHELLHQEVYGCPPDAEIEEALRVMQQRSVRRIPVFDQDRNLRGILSLNDLILSAMDRRAGAGYSAISYDDVMAVLKAVSEHQIARSEAKARMTNP
jgi:CBS domain-containing protein